MRSPRAVSFFLRAKYPWLRIFRKEFSKQPWNSFIRNRYWIIGCGTGRSLDYFLSKGIDAIGIEGSGKVISKAKHPERILHYDLNHELSLHRKFDLLWSYEFVEHIHPKFVHRLMKTFSRHSDTVVISAAHPGQGGDGHFNEQPAAYWIELFRNEGYEFNREKTDLLRSMDDPYARNMMVLLRR